MCCCLCMYINKGRVLKPRVYFRSLSVSWSSLSVFSLVISVTFCQSCCESLHLYIWPPYHPVCLCCPCCFLLCFCLYSVWKHLLSGSRSHVWCIMSLFSPRDTVCLLWSEGRMHHSCVCPPVALFGSCCDCREWWRSNPRTCLLFRHSLCKTGGTVCFNLSCWSTAESDVKTVNLMPVWLQILFPH